MREIKFRAWNKLSKVMLSEEWTRYHLTDILQVRWHFDEDKTFDLMQYTGLKDKNGKEIYEGDIVREILTGVVMYEAPEFVAITKKGSTFTADNGCEVIGNIYENGELLGVK